MQIKRTIIFILFFITSSMAMACDNKDDLSFLKEKMPYVEARKLLIEHGWQPFSFGITGDKEAISQCLVRVSKSSCLIDDLDDYCIEMKDICFSFPEYDTWSSEGYAMMIVENSQTHKQLFISIFGDENINPSNMYVRGWHYDEWKK